MKYNLTDGSEVFETRDMTTSEAMYANQHAQAETDGNIYWAPAEQSENK